MLSASGWFLFLAYSLTQKMEATFSSETSVDFERTTRRYIPEDLNLHKRRCEILEAYRPKPDYYYYYSQGGVRLSPHGMSATSGPTVPAPDDECVWSSWWNENWQGKQK
jgi:hypothetical protein